MPTLRQTATVARAAASAAARASSLRRPAPASLTRMKMMGMPTSSSSSSSNLVLPAARAFSTTPRRAGGGGMQYDPPTGWLWGVRPGEKYQNEGWEGLFFYGFWGSLIVFAIAYAWKPDTSIQTWALEEARRRLEAEGILEDPEKK